MNILVTICARGGSKGVRNKNVRPLLGKPLIAHTIGQALAWGRASRVVVSTDSEEIATVARRFGAEVPFRRPAELAEDSSPKMPVIRHALQQSEELFATEFPVVVDLDPTAPLRTREDLDSCLARFTGTDAQALFSVVRAHKNPYFNMVELGGDGYAALCKGLPEGVCRRQDAPEVYSMNSSIYFYRREYLLDPATMLPYTGRSMVHVMADHSAFDIDREIDFRFLEFLVKEGVAKL